jgi:hypothetical protein
MSKTKKVAVIPDPDAKRRFDIIVDGVWGGRDHLKDEKWIRPNVCEIWLHGTLATFDFSEMTRLVVLCHDNCVRAEVRRNRGLSVLLSARSTTPTHALIEGHPSLEQHIAAIRGGREAYQKMLHEMLAVTNHKELP